MGTLDGRVAMVTGAGRGLGCTVALLFEREGADVAAVDVDAPAAKETEMTERLDAALASLGGRDYATLHADRAREVPLGRRAAPDEVAQASLWLAGPAAAYVTGWRLNVSGGLELD